MRIEGRAEYSNWGKVERVPVIAGFVGFGRLIQSLFATKSKEHQAFTYNFKTHLWSEAHRGAVAMIPLFGAFAVIAHDAKVHRAIDKLKTELRTATRDDGLQFTFQQFPQDVKDSKACMFELVKINPEILTLGAFHTLNSNIFNLIKDPEFMLDVVKIRPENLKYASEELLKNRKFILDAVKATDADLFAVDPRLIAIYKDDPEVMLEMAKRNLDNLRHANKLMEDENFVLKAALELYNDSYYCYCFPEGKKRPQYNNHLPILKYAPTLCQNANFMLKAKAFPYLKAVHYAGHFAGNKEFILKMMRNYSTPGGWFRGSYSGIQLDSLAQIIPLAQLASDDVRNDVDFMKQAMAIEPESWKLASEDVKKQIFADKKFLSQFCGIYSIMTEAVKRDKSNLEVVSHSLRVNSAFIDFISKNCPENVYNELYGTKPRNVRITTNRGVTYEGDHIGPCIIKGTV